MIFAATVEHAGEILSLLPPDQAALVSAERDRLIDAFRAQRLRYLVNVSVLTTGFDAPHVDVIAILCPTESVSLYQQIVGHDLRLYPGKTGCLILDYAGNVHDLYSSEVGQTKLAAGSQPAQVFCPACGFANLFWGKTAGQHGYRTLWPSLPGLLEDESGARQQCDYRFRFKLCPDCDAQNDIAVRRYHHCQRILLDPDDMLKAALRLKDALVLHYSGMSLRACQDGKGNGYRSPILMRTAPTSASVSAYTRRRSDGCLRCVFCPYICAPRECLLPGAADKLRAPDFVVARRRCHFWQVREKVFDYQGRFRRAHELRGLQGFVCPAPVIPVKSCPFTHKHVYPACCWVACSRFNSRF